MPLIKTIGEYDFRFFSRGEQGERPHIHVERGRLRAKFWLLPVELANGGRFKRHELNKIERLVEENR
jgi:hypothetical protein